MVVFLIVAKIVQFIIPYRQYAAKSYRYIIAAAFLHYTYIYKQTLTVDYKLREIIYYKHNAIAKH